MVEISKNPNTFIRSTPSRGTLGGISMGTREASIILDAAGYDFIFIETVGVGQSEIVATSFADMGFDVDMGPLFQSPKDVAKDAIENDVHAIGVSTLAAGHKTLVPELMKGLKEIDPKSKIIVFVGGIIPEQDYEFLYENNVSAIFGPGSNIIESAEKVIDLISDNLSKE